MANHPAAALVLREGDREKLVRLMHSPSVRAGLAGRARIVLLAAEGMSNLSSDRYVRFGEQEACDLR